MQVHTIRRFEEWHMFARSQSIRHLKTAQSHWSYELISLPTRELPPFLLFEELKSYRYSMIY